MSNVLPGINDCAECLAPRPRELPPVPDGHAWFCTIDCARKYFDREEAQRRKLYGLIIGVLA